VLGNETERAALVEALLEGRVSEHPGLWEVADLLRIPAHGPYVVVAAQAPGVGKQALPQIDAKLLSFDIFSAWRLLPDLQLGIVHVRNDGQFDKLIALLRRTATTRVGVSSRYDNLADTHDAVRFARVALNDRTAADSAVTVFDDSLLGMAAVSSPEVMNRLAETLLGRFDDMPAEERAILFETFRAWSEHGGSVNDAAAELFCHPNTVRHRLRRIEERTNRSLGKPRDLAELCLVFEIDRRLR
jgi:DNA-binding PucR family transcriptional regulator